MSTPEAPMTTEWFFSEAKRLKLRMLGTPEETRAALYAKDAEIERLRKIEDEWARLSQDEGKAEREIERLTAAHHAAVEMSNTMHGRWLAAEAERDALRTAAEAMVAWLRAEEDHTGTTFMQRVHMCDHAQKLLEAAVGSWKPAATSGDKP
jgi:hypothetical protein